jgi:hypothetical protein
LFALRPGKNLDEAVALKVVDTPRSDPASHPSASWRGRRWWYASLALQTAGVRRPQNRRRSGRATGQWKASEFAGPAPIYPSKSSRGVLGQHLQGRKAGAKMGRWVLVETLDCFPSPPEDRKVLRVTHSLLVAGRQNKTDLETRSLILVWQLLKKQSPLLPKSYPYRRVAWLESD